MNILRKSRPSISSLFRSIKTLPPNPHRPPPRSFYTDRQPSLQHFSRRGRGHGGYHWYRDPRVVVAVTFISGAAAVTIYFGNLETVPYTKRTHFVLLSPAIERQLGEAEFEQLKRSLKSKILPPFHPDSIRVRLIAKQIIGAVQRGLRHEERRWSDLEYGHGAEESVNWNGDESLKVLGLDGKKEEVGWSKEDEILDDRWVKESRRKKKGTEPAARHLEGLNWEVIVVRENAVNAFCLPGGKIVVFTGLLDHFRTDAEIATVIAHEVYFFLHPFAFVSIHGF